MVSQVYINTVLFTSGCCSSGSRRGITSSCDLWRKDYKSWAGLLYWRENEERHGCYLCRSFLHIGGEYPEVSCEVLTGKLMGIKCSQGVNFRVFSLYNWAVTSLNDSYRICWKRKNRLKFFTSVFVAKYFLGWWGGSKFLVLLSWFDYFDIPFKLCILQGLFKCCKSHHLPGCVIIYNEA